MKMQKYYLGYENAIPMPEHEQAQCRILTDYNGNKYLLSYSTIVCSIVNGWFFCSGLYSRTTIKHIGWFAKYISAHFGVKLNYYDIKRLYENGEVLNIETGEVLTYEKFNTIQESEKRTA